MESSMYRIDVVTHFNCKDSEFIARPSALGNPYPIGPDASRDIVCDHYEDWFHERVELNDPLVMHELKRLHRVGKDKGVLKLGCYCAPRRCHGDTIKHFLERNYDLMEMLISC